MISEIIVRPKTELDLKDAFNWYEEQKLGLGNKLIDAIDNCISSISNNPESFPFVHNNIRRALIKKFPFGIFYVSEKSKIIILAFFHLSRNPKVWKKRK